MVDKNKIPCVVGSTGLVGSHLIENLSKIYPKVHSITRKKVIYNSPKIENIVIDFDNIQNEKIFSSSNDLYIGLGTTIKKAGSDRNFIKVDYDYCIALARNAFESGVKRLSIISSVGSNPDSKLLYPRTKGLIERDLKKLSFDHVSIMKPGLILGDRKESRFTEKAAKYLFSLFNPFLFGGFKKYKSIHADTISQAMIYQVSKGKNGFYCLEFSELLESSKK
jgi:uncharacterized protein YbjT (DUF2867 family)|tara:strand:- start:3356 stop:4021 length:666 start_codon:yes stop_codon:yes gene_type:complete